MFGLGEILYCINAGTRPEFLNELLTYFSNTITKKGPFLRAFFGDRIGERRSYFFSSSSSNFSILVCLMVMLVGPSIILNSVRRLKRC